MFSKIKEFLFGKLPEQKAPEAPVLETAPYKVPEPPATTSIPLISEAVVIKPEAVAPTLVVDTISTAVAQPASTPAKPKKPRAPAKPKAKPVVSKAPAAKKPRKPRAK